jgi:hypothetical protein
MIVTTSIVRGEAQTQDCNAPDPRDRGSDLFLENIRLIELMRRLSVDTALLSMPCAMRSPALKDKYIDALRSPTASETDALRRTSRATTVPRL